MHDYISVHAGPRFSIEYAYTTILMQVSIVCMFGASMPILYPIVFIAMLSTYITDRFAVCYFYREPPQYDERITLKMLKYIKFCVVCSLPFAYWQLGNRAIFENKNVHELVVRNFLTTGHTIWYALINSNPFSTGLTFNHAPIVLFYVLVIYFAMKHAIILYK